MYGSICTGGDSDSDRETLTMERDAKKRSVNGDVRGETRTPNGGIVEVDPLEDRRSFKGKYFIF